MSIFEEQFTLGQVAEAISTNPETIKTWIRKEVIVNTPSAGRGPGVPRLHSFYGVMEMAIAAALIEAGVRDNAVIWLAASNFAHAGDGGTGSRPGRVPGCPFPEGLTYVAVGGGRSVDVCYRPGNDMMAATRSALGGAEVIIFIEINRIFRRIVTALGHNPEEVRQIAQEILAAMAPSEIAEG